MRRSNGALAFCPTDGRLLASAGHNRFDGGGYDPYVRIWDVAEGEVVVDVRHRDALDRVRWSWQPDGQALFAASGDGIDRCMIYRWKFDGPASIRTSGVSCRWPVCPTVACSVGSERRDDPSPGARPVATVRAAGAHRPRRMLAFSPPNNQIASGSSDETIRLWDAATNTKAQVLAGHKGRVQSLAYSPDGSTLASASFDGTVKIWGLYPSNRTELQACRSRVMQRSSWRSPTTFATSPC